MVRCGVFVHTSMPCKLSPHLFETRSESVVAASERNFSLAFFFAMRLECLRAFYARTCLQHIIAMIECDWLFFSLLIVPMFNSHIYDATTQAKFHIQIIQHMHEIPCAIVISTFRMKNQRKQNSRFNNIREMKCDEYVSCIT